ncbi:nuclease-related domain-containing DEAD/DEAH box helicase [Rhizobium sp. NZLR8]|uniref:nuclease-related domain-containing DEAD/DEAH box helicase n=1 Tax=Rhizobium sp. NZLR8 TaxID=2731104 RepID=UPI002180CBDD|nr:NERD domain-containing protein/DEAD/DEAH box helicase [Rhizobium sp. NZLR8]
MARLRQPLTPGEQAVLDLFMQQLSPEWEIYVQPHLNGLRPDFVLLNPDVGIAVFEVKDWNLDSMHYFTKKAGRGHALWASRDGVEFSIQSQNPVTKVNLYRKEIYDLYCPRLGAKSGWATITAGVIFPFASIGRVENLMHPWLPTGEEKKFARYQPTSGAEAVSSGNLHKIFPESARKSSFVMSGKLADDLRGWLVEPDFAATQRLPLMLDRNQQNLADTRTETGYRRIKGPAGSGKSLVLGARAAKLANEGKEVLIVTFNITLWHYLRDIIVRGLNNPQNIRNVELTHFHLWCKHTCYGAGFDDRYDALWTEDEKQSQKKHMDVTLPMLTLEASQTPDAKRYDAILVDEGQDYLPLWWDVLRQSCKQKGEMLLVADATQDIYGTVEAWTDDVMKGAGFGGRWAQLSASYRLPPDVMGLARKFAETFLPAERIDLPEPEQGSFDLYPSHLSWVQCEPQDGDEVCSHEIIKLMQHTGKLGLANADITLLAGDMVSGGKAVQRLSDQNIKAVDTFGDDHRRKKMGFFMGDARIKATTLHSFKGWEARLLVVYVTNASHAQSLALVYAGLTRLKRSQEGSWLTVICSAPELAEYGKAFPTHRRVAALNASSKSPSVYNGRT